MEDIKRLNYYDHQFLRAEDFIAEQKYHLDMRRRHNQNLHTFGIVWGLDVKSESDGIVSVSAGEAIDRNGQEMIFAGGRLQLNAAAEGTDSYITIKYEEVKSDRTEETGGAGFTRKTEKPIVAPSSTKPVEPSDFLTLAKLKRTGNAWVVVDPPERSQRAGVALGEDFTVKTLTLKKGDDPSKWPKLSCGDQGALTISSAAVGTYAYIKNGKHEVLLGVDANSAILSTMTASDLEIRTNNTKRVVVQANTGNVGIGPDTPGHNLSISSVGETGAYASIKNGKHEVLLGVDANSAILSTIAASDLQIRTNNATRVVVQKDTGNVGIGSAAPSKAKFAVNGAMGNTVAVFGGDKKGMSLGVDWPFLGFNCYFNGEFKAISAGRAGDISFAQDDGSMRFSFEFDRKGRRCQCNTNPCNWPLYLSQRETGQPDVEGDAGLCKKARARWGVRHKRAAERGVQFGRRNASVHFFRLGEGQR